MFTEIKYKIGDLCIKLEIKKEWNGNVKIEKF